MCINTVDPVCPVMCINTIDPVCPVMCMNRIDPVCPVCQSSIKVAAIVADVGDLMTPSDSRFNSCLLLAVCIDYDVS